MSTSTDYLIHYLKADQNAVAELSKPDNLGGRGYQYFTGVDRKIAEYLWIHGRGNPAAFAETIGKEGLARLKEVDATVLRLSPRFTPAVIAQWCKAQISAWMQAEGVMTLTTAQFDLAGADAPGDVLGRVIQKLNEITVASVGDDFESDPITATNSLIDDLANGGRGSYITTRRKNFTAAFFGWQRDAVNLLGGVPGSGKTTYILNDGFDAARDGYKVLVVSLEMTPPELRLREVFRQARATRRDLLERSTTAQRYEQACQTLDRLRAEDADYDLIVAAQNHIAVCQRAMVDDSRLSSLKEITHALAELPLRFTQPTFKQPTAYRLLPVIRRFAEQFGGVDMVILDHAEKMRPERQVPQSEVVKTIYAEIENAVLPAFSGISFVALQHLNADIYDERDVSKLNPTVRWFNYQGGGTAYQAFVLIRPIQHKGQFKDFKDDKLDALKAENPDTYYKIFRQAYIIPVKNRDGEQSQQLNFQFYGQYYDFEEVDV